MLASGNYQTPRSCEPKNVLTRGMQTKALGFIHGQLYTNLSIDNHNNKDGGGRWIQDLSREYNMFSSHCRYQ